MAENHPEHPSATAFLIALSLISTLAAVESNLFSRNLSPSSLGLKKPEKLSHLHFYFHDVVTGKNVTAVRVSKAPTTTKSSPFGAAAVMDDPLTISPDIGSKLVGKAQGIYALASQTEASLLMAFNFAFVEGKYNGSNLSVLGRNPVFSGVREMPVIGGSGVFSFARGYAEARTHTFDLKTGNAVVEYNSNSIQTENLLFNSSFDVADGRYSLLMAYNFAFIKGKHNGSNLSVLGRNPVFSAVREMPVIGGSGVFRFARGDAEAKTHTFDLKTGI
ncbi:hypothetical protein Goklo_029694 [Gossypium klotzschianum]|uniref:Dirigent protein n=1 Tax=Gossypium klotzschianum TaxID=34286 RepID=A0A7J8W4B7_9ROSI|nr:hypothetical protein [Gossypium klotzschianum]